MSARATGAVLLLCLCACSSPPGAGPPGSAGSGGSGCATDADGDGHVAIACGGDDCDDADPAVHPGAIEACGDPDRNCDGVQGDCACAPGVSRGCYPENLDPRTRNRGICRDGVQTCASDGSGFGACTGAVGPQPEGATCDGIDQDCNGIPDDGLTNACGVCGALAADVCGNGLDDDCNGIIDDPSICVVSCLGVDPVNPPPHLVCCLADPDTGAPAQHPTPFSFTCVEDPETWQGLQPCIGPPDTRRACLNVAGDGVACTESCIDTDGDGKLDRCTCGVGQGDAVVRSPSCGFPTPCAHVNCDNRQNQPCYSGPPPTLGKGICHGGVASCSDDGTGTGALGWSSCEGEQVPRVEICGNGLDDDCDGLIDEDDGVAACPRTGICQEVERCGDGVDSDCNGQGGPGEPEDVGCCVPAGPEVCNGRDDDCDGLADEGVVNACGKCGEETCFTYDAHDPANCAADPDRICSRIIPDPNNTDAFTLSSYWGGGGGTNEAYFSVPDRQSVVKLDTITGQKLWETGAPDVPGRMAIPLDSSVWVASRAGASGHLLHLDRDGNVVCQASLPGLPGGLAIDSSFDQVWVGLTDPPELRTFAGNATDGVGPDGMPVCSVIGDPVELLDPVVGLAIDDRGIAWTASGTDRTVRLDTLTLTQDLIQHAGVTASVAVAGESAWFAGTPVHAIAADGPYTPGVPYERDFDASANALTIAHDGHVWAMGSRLFRIEPPDAWALPQMWPRPVSAVAEDDAGKIWIPLQDGRSARFDPVTEEFQSFDVAPGHAPSAVVAGGPYRARLRRRGTWSQTIDSGYASTIWKALLWTELHPDETEVVAQMFFANEREALDTAPACGPLTSPADLTRCPGSRQSRFARVFVFLMSAPTGAKPTVGNIRVDYTRP